MKACRESRTRLGRQAKQPNPSKETANQTTGLLLSERDDMIAHMQPAISRADSAVFGNPTTRLGVLDLQLQGTPGEQPSREIPRRGSPGMCAQGRKGYVESKIPARTFRHVPPRTAASSGRGADGQESRQDKH